MHDKTSTASPSDEEYVARVSGTLLKWTNYIYGWQQRYFEIENGVLLYYRSKAEKPFGCRGSITLRCSLIEEDDYDQLRFSITIGGISWFLRADSPENKKIWIHVLRLNSDSGCCSRAGSHDDMSVSSSPLKCDFARYTEDANVLINELKDCCLLLQQQTDHIHRQLHDSGNLVRSHLFAEECLAFRNTTSAVISNVAACVELLLHLSDQVVATGKECRESGSQTSQTSFQTAMTGTVDLDSSLSVPSKSHNSLLNDDDQEWHDAVDSAVQQQHLVEAIDELSLEGERIPGNSRNSPKLSPSGILTLSSSYPLFNQIDKLSNEQLKYAKAGVEDKVWEIFAEEGEMKMYKMDVEVDGLVCDPLKAVHCVPGVSAREFIHFFFEPKYKNDWDETLERMKVVEIVSEDTLIIHQIHRRIWPAAQRESLFWSHVRQVDSMKDSDAHDLFMVCNHSCDRGDVPLVDPSNIRVGLTVAMVCQTVIKNSNAENVASIDRQNVECRVVYVAQVHPGGWAPSAALRIIYKKEYPKFLRGLTKYIKEQLRNRSLVL